VIEGLEEEDHGVVGMVKNRGFSALFWRVCYANQRMSNAFYASGPERAVKVHSLFTAIARRYDLINDLQSFGLHRRWKRQVALLANVTQSDSALDVCCGTGDLAFALAERGAQVVGLDFSQAMLAIAQSKMRNRKRGVKYPRSETESPQFFRGDTQRLPFSDASFDIVTVGYGLRNLSSWETGLSEMARVARPGGRLLVLDFGKPGNALWRAIYFGYLRLAVPLLGLVFCGNAGAYAYILESLRHYPAQCGIEAEMRKLSLGNVQVVNLLGGAMSINYGEKRGACA
jgi:demethylmenaquinone methyltransferase / 2-methoxy-6-polyprenyl-1,4-benzoquinol methylase